MAQIVNPAPNIGYAFGTGLSQGLQQLANAKMEELAQRKKAGNIEQTLLGLNVDPAIAKMVPLLPEQLQGYFFQNLGNFIQQPQQQQQGEVSPVLQQLAGKQYEVPTVGGMQFPQPPAPVKLAAPQQAIAAQPQPAISKAEQLAQALISPQQKQFERKFEQKERQLSQAEKAAAFKETRKEREKIINEAQMHKDRLEDLNRLEELEQTGKLDTPGYVEGLKRAGLDIPALLNPESEEFAKVTQSFIRDAKSYYGGKVSNLEMEQFLRQIPSLSQSPEGRKRVISNMKRISRLKVEASNALRDIIKRNKGIPPLDLAEQIDEHLDKQRTKLAEQFKKDLEKPVPAGQNKLITGLQASLGTVAGRIPKAAAGAGIGALVGGPTGAVIGGLGGLSGLGLKDLL